jgi:sugar lactone lactonase YvrE
MKPARSRKPITIKNSLTVVAIGVLLLLILIAGLWFFWPAKTMDSYKFVSTITGERGEIGEPFGIAVRKSNSIFMADAIYISDGQNNEIWSKSTTGIFSPVVFAAGLDTPSGIVFDQSDNLLVADTGSNSIRSVNRKGEISVLAGVVGHSGFADGDAASALFYGPMGIAVDKDGKVFVADTYNDRIRVIENGKVTTLAGSTAGYADGIGFEARFDTPTGLAIWQDKLLVADSGNGRIRAVEPDGRVWTLAGNGEGDLKDGLLAESSFAQPTAIVVDKNDMIFISDGNAIRRIGGNAMPVVTTISSEWRGLADGIAARSRFNRPSGLAIDSNGDLIVADAENRLVRRFSATTAQTAIKGEQIAELRDKSYEFRDAAPARWPYDPPTTKRDIAGTLGEIRGLMTSEGDNVWFHNGLDIAGAYGETARFIRDEKVLRPIAIENFGTLRELIRMPTLGYIHIRLGRDADGKQFNDDRFQFRLDATGKLTGVRVPRGTKFKAGDPIGTLNPMNHVHLIAGRSGSEMNALDALILPGIADSRPPVIGKVTLFDQKWIPVETVSPNSRIKITAKTRIVVRAYDQMDGNSERRRLGVYKLGYQVLNSDKTPVAEPKWTIHFDRMPSNDAVRFAYANESHSGATGETIFNYIVSNFVNGDEYREEFLDPASLGTGHFTIRVLAADYFGNTSSKDVDIEVLK